DGLRKGMSVLEELGSDACSQSKLTLAQRRDQPHRAPRARGILNSLAIEVLNASTLDVGRIQPRPESGLRQQREFVRRIAAIEVGCWVLLGKRSEEHTSELQSLTNLVCR